MTHNTTRHEQQAAGIHPAPCARHCESPAFKIEIRRLEAENKQLRAEVERIAELEQKCRTNFELDALARKCDAQSAALAKAREALEAFAGGTLTHDGHIIGLMREDFDEAREALAAIDAFAQFDGAHAEEHAHPASDADNAIYQSIARNYTAQVSEEGKEPRHD